MHELYNTDPTQEQRPTVAVDRADCTAPTGQHEPDHTDQESTHPAWQMYIMNYNCCVSLYCCTSVLGIDNLSEVWNAWKRMDQPSSRSRARSIQPSMNDYWWLRALLIEQLFFQIFLFFISKRNRKRFQSLEILTGGQK